MDVTPYLALRSAPQVLFNHLDERRSRPRFMLPTPDGDWRAVTWGNFARETGARGGELPRRGRHPPR